MVRGKKAEPVEEAPPQPTEATGGNEVEELMVAQGNSMVQMETLLKELRRHHKTLEKMVSKMNKPAPKARTPRKKATTTEDSGEEIP